MAVQWEPEQWYKLLAYSSAGLSLIFNTFQLWFYLSIPEVRTFFVKLLFYLSFCDWFTALSVFIPGESNSIICHIQAGFQQFFSSSSFMWMVAVAFTMFMTITKGKQYMWKFELLYHILVWPFPIITTIVMYIALDYSSIKYRGT